MDEEEREYRRIEKVNQWVLGDRKNCPSCGAELSEPPLKIVDTVPTLRLGRVCPGCGDPQWTEIHHPLDVSRWLREKRQEIASPQKAKCRKCGEEFPSSRYEALLGPSHVTLANYRCSKCGSFSASVEVSLEVD